MERNIAFFDFDGTITRKDTMLELVKFSHGKAAFYFGMITIFPSLLAMKAGIINNQRGKEILLKRFYDNTSIEDFDKTCKLFTDSVLPALIRPDAMLAVEKHLKDGDKVVVVSASAENWVAPWCNQYGIETLCSRLQTSPEGKITGRLTGTNCNAQEKVNRILLSYDPAEFDSIYAYGDSEGDKQMLSLATHPFYRTFTR